MIKHLYIQNFILIDKLNLDFEDGFSAFIGETGAGKSILIDAISLLFADRGSASYISKGKDKAIIEGTFDLSKDNHAKRVLEEANYIIQTGKTVREIASLFKVSKSTVHKDLHERLLKIDKEKYKNVEDILKYHIDIRHIRGGESTRKKYLNILQ